MPKPVLRLSTQQFIFNVGVDEVFRNKYLGNPELLAKDFSISKKDLESIRRIDVEKLKAELEGFTEIDAVKNDLLANGYHCNSSHINHCKGGSDHCKDSHTKDCGSIIDNIMERVLPETLIKVKDVTKVVNGKIRKGKTIR